MRAMRFQNWPQHPAQPRGDHPLAQSAFNGENRLRELEHLAETARKVRDQAAAELTRNGNAHHIARDRLAAAERMLQKTQKEMQELRAQLGLDKPKPQPKPTAQSAEDFELAMLLGTRNKRLKRDELGPDTFTIEADEGPRSSQFGNSQFQGTQSYRSEGPASREQTRQRSPSRQRGKPQPAPSRGRRYDKPSSLLRIFAIGLFVLLGVGLGAAGTYLMVTSESVPDAAQKVSDGATQVTSQLKNILPQDTTSSADGAATEQNPSETPAAAVAIPPAEQPTTAIKPKPVKLDPFQKRALEEQEERQRKAAAERLAKAIAEQKAAEAAREHAAQTHTEPAYPAGYPPQMGTPSDSTVIEDPQVGVSAPVAAPVAETGTTAELAAPVETTQMTAPAQQQAPTLQGLPLTHPEAFEEAGPSR